MREVIHAWFMRVVLLGDGEAAECVGEGSRLPDYHIAEHAHGLAICPKGWKAGTDAAEWVTVVPWANVQDYTMRPYQP